MTEIDDLIRTLRRKLDAPDHNLVSLSMLTSEAERLLAALIQLSEPSTGA